MSAALRRLTPRQWLLVGWVGFLLYAWPGFMSFDSIYQLQESRSGYFTDGHPPMMAQLWRIVELFVAGPAGMLMIQSAAFLYGVYLIFRRRMAERTAAIAASLFLWFPPIGSVIAVIWKDSQMTAWIVLGVGLMISDRRRTKVLGLLAILVGTGMRHNALVMTLPLIGLLFVWDERHGFIKRYAIAIAAFVAVTLGARLVTSALTDQRRYLWHDSLALCDITSTLRLVEPPMTDAQLRAYLAGMRIKPEVHDLGARLQHSDPKGSYVDNLWWTAYDFFILPKTAEHRAEIERVWKKTVFEHKREYLAYRWEVFRRLLGLGDESWQSPMYTWFVDVQGPMYTHIRIHHDATGSHLQDWLRAVAHWFGRGVLFRVMVYIALAFLLLPFWIRDREVAAWILSALGGEAFLFIFTPTTDWRYSYWMILSVGLGVLLLVARRASTRNKLP